ncbi:MAG: IS110 family transposase [Planctomycetes bacterium]|nr:IS110 family transposase [Planctomycetota bacterium]
MSISVLVVFVGAVEFDQPLLREVFDCYFTEMRHCLQRVKTLDRELEKLAQSDDYREVVGILRCFFGIETLTAISIIAEVFDFGRFASARAFMSYLGLTPSESSSGEKEHKGRITKTGNKRVRQLLTEAAWHHRHTYVVSKALNKRREGQPQWAIEITIPAWPPGVEEEAHAKIMKNVTAILIKKALRTLYFWMVVVG